MHKTTTHVALKNGLCRAPEQVAAELLSACFPTSAEPVIVAVGGPGGTGKSTFAQALVERLPDAAVLRLDDYKVPRSLRAERNLFGPHPEANDISLLQEHLAALKQGRSFERPVYDKAIGKATSTAPYHPLRFNILDGEIATYPELREWVDFSIFIDSDWQTQLATRLGRDMEDRGYDREKAIATFLHSNLREFSEYAEVGLKGLIVPVLTPFDETGAIDQRAFIRHLEFLAHHGVHRIMVNGTTAEFYALLPDERKTLLKLARRYFPGLIVLHAGGSGLAQNRIEVQWADEFGADAVAVLPPIYPAGLSAAGVIEYLCALHAETDVPFLIYNFPKHTGNPVTPEILEAVPHDGIKDSGQDLSLMEHTPRYFIGSSSTIFTPVQQGAAGFVAATANVRPALYADLETLLVSARVEEADLLQQEVRAYTKPFSAGGVPLLKQALSRELPGYPVAIRAPLRQAR